MPLPSVGRPRTGGQHQATPVFVTPVFVTPVFVTPVQAIPMGANPIWAKPRDAFQTFVCPMTFTLSWPLWAAFAMTGLAFLLVFVRLVRGPGLPDRVVAVDVIAYFAIGVIALWTLVSGETAYLDAALVLALIAFLATVAFARFVETRPPVS